MTVSVLVPYSGDCPHRSRAWEWVRAQYEAHHPDWEINVGVYSGAGWSKGSAVADAASRASGDVFVVADADVWCDTVEQATLAVVCGAAWVVPHGKVHRLSQPATGAVCAGATPTLDMEVERRPYTGLLGGGIVCLTAESYERAPIDPRFDGWGSEDMAWSCALQTLVGRPVRLDAPLYHLWHPPQEKPTAMYGSAANRGLFRRYQQAHKKRIRMERLIGEGRCKLTGSSTDVPSSSP